MATSGLYGSSPSGATVAAPGSESAGLYGNSTTFGGSYFEWFIFIQSDTQPATPTGGSWSFTTNSGTPPTGWSVVPPSAPTLPIWVSIALVNSKNSATLTWSAPGLFAYSSGLPILSGSGEPNPGDGLTSQLYIQTGTTPETIWFKQAGTWTRLTGSTLYADLTSNQTIAGTKTFSSPIAGSVTGTSANVTGIVGITNGGTGSTTAAGARTALGVTATGQDTTYAYRANNLSDLASASSARTNLGLGSSAVLNAGVANGVATLDSGGTVPLSQIPASIQGGVSYQGTWNASTNTPTLTSSVGTKGYYYVVSVAGSTNLNGITDWQIGDWAIYSGTAWQKIDNTDAVTSVNGYTGTVVLNAADVGALSNVTSTDGSVTITSPTSTTRDLSVATAASTTNVLCQVRNTTGATLTKGTVVYISGATGQLPTVSKAIATGDSTSAQTLGMMTADLANNSNGYVTVIGLITDIDTSAYTDGAQLYLSGTTAGAVTATKPSAPIHLVYIAVVEYAHPTQGKLFVKVQNGYELDEIHDVSIVSPTTGQTLVYSASTDLWSNSNAPVISGTTINNTTIGATTASSGAFTTLSASSDVTLSGGTANGVLYLNGSKQASSGSALTFDGSLLEVSSSAAQALTLNGGGTNTGSIRFKQNGADRAYFGGANWAIGGNANDFALSTAGAYSLIFGVNNTEAMRLTSTSLYTASGINVGIGLSNPDAKLHVSTPDALAAVIATTRASGSFIRYELGANGAATGYMGSGGQLISGAGVNDFALRSDGSNLLFSINSTEKGRFTSSGFNVTGTISVGAVQAVAARSFGYGGGYGFVQIGTNNTLTGNVALAIDVSGVAGGSFNGQNQVILPNNGALFVNAAGTNFIGAIGRDANDSILLGPNSVGGITSGDVVIRTSGYVGIGTNNPAAMLDVNGTARVLNGLILVGANTSLYNADGALSRYNASNNAVYLNGNDAGWLALQASGSQKTYINLYGNTEASTPNSINFVTNSAERMRITSAGNILKQYGTEYQSYTSGGSISHMMSYQTWNGTGNILVVGNTFGDVVFGTGGGTMTEKGRFDTSGSLNIGRATKINNSKVTIAASSGAPAIGVEWSDNTYLSQMWYSADYSMGIFASAATRELGLVANSADGLGRITFSVSGNGTITQRAMFDQYGNFGISNAGAPQAKLDVNISGVARLMIGYSGGSSNYFDATDNIFRGGNGVEVGRFISAGCLLLGCDNNNGGKIQTQTTGSNSSGANQQITFRLNDNGAYAGIRLSTDGSFCFDAYTTSGWQEVQRFDRSGNLLVGTIDTGFNARQLIRFEATGSTTNGLAIWNGGGSGATFAAFSNSTGGFVGTITQSGTTAVLYNTTSDQRLKENIVDADSASSLIDSLQVRKFDWKADGSHQRYGFVAQELVTVAPEAVHQPTDTEQMMAVDYSKLVPMLVKEIQSLRQRVAQLETN